MHFGLFWTSFLSATILPGGSEALFLYMLHDGFSLPALFFWATFGNVLGAATCYYLGRLGYSSRIERWLRIPKSKVSALAPKVQKWGPWLGLFAWAPIVGDPFVVALGYFRTPALPTFVCVTVGKFLRYAFLASAGKSIFSMMGT